MKKGVKMKSIEEIISLIDTEMDFYSYVDFYNNAELLKNMYIRYCGNNIRTKKLYCWYVYSRRMTTTEKNMVWDYLNNDINLGDLTDYYLGDKNNSNEINEDLLNLLGGF